jgi:UrcA family protein
MEDKPGETIMANKSFAVRAVPVGLLLALASGGSAIAQGTAPTEVKEITVVAPRITYQAKREGGSVIPKEVTIAKKTALVSYADLDLSRSADLYTLEDRIAKAAAQVCEELAQELPDGEPATAVCTRRATDDAMAHLRMVTRPMATRP